MGATWRKVYRGREYVCWKIAGKQYRRLAHRWLWEQTFGPIPPRYEIHHKGENPLNNAIENLECVTPEWHDNHHQRKREDHCVVNDIEQRRCQRCHEYKPLDGFSIRRAGTRHGYCQPCVRVYLIEWRAKNRVHWNAYQREYRRKRQAA